MSYIVPSVQNIDCGFVGLAYWKAYKQFGLYCWTVFRIGREDVSSGYADSAAECVEKAKRQASIMNGIDAA